MYLRAFKTVVSYLIAVALATDETAFMEVPVGLYVTNTDAH